MIRRDPPRGSSGIDIGSRVPIPCRLCGKEMIPYFVTEGTTLLKCTATGKPMQVIVTRVEGVLRIRTQRDH